MKQLTDEQLIKVYLQAKQFKLDTDFIELLENELSRRHLIDKIIKFPDAVRKDNLRGPFETDQIG